MTLAGPSLLHVHGLTIIITLGPSDQAVLLIRTRHSHAKHDLTLGCEQVRHFAGITATWQVHQLTLPGSGRSCVGLSSTRFDGTGCGRTSTRWDHMHHCAGICSRQSFRRVWMLCTRSAMTPQQQQRHKVGPATRWWMWITFYPPPLDGTVWPRERRPS
jgi:hypothetical protein